MIHEQIIVNVTRDGQVFAETRGIKGPRCLESIQLLETLLDAETVSSSFTHEYSESLSTNTLEVNDDLQQR